MTDHDLTDDVRSSLRASADRLEIDIPPFASLGVRAAPATTAPAPRRWIVPLMAAAVVVALAVAIPLVTRHGEDRSEQTLTVSGPVADIGGVRFPVPPGWRPTIIGSSQDSVTVCVAADPATASCDGVELRIAVPDVDGNAPPLPNGFPNDLSCGTAGTYYLLDDQSPTVGGRPANHYWQSCGADGPQQHLWELTDLSLQISTPPGSWEPEGASIAAGLDLSAWPVQPGPQIVFTTSGTSSTR